MLYNKQWATFLDSKSKFLNFGEKKIDHCISSGAKSFEGLKSKPLMISTCQFFQKFSIFINHYANFRIRDVPEILSFYCRKRKLYCFSIFMILILCKIM